MRILSRREGRCRAAIISVLLSAIGVPAAGRTLFTDTFAYPDGLITNEYAYWNRTGAPGAAWEANSGSFFARGGTGWTGVPDDVPPNAGSTNGNNSAVFRLNTVRSDFGDVEVSFSLLNRGLKTSPSTPATDWDGLHVWLRYQSEEHLYYASFNRRDGTSLIKKKVPGGPSNGGTYYVLGATVRHAVPYNVWQRARATVKNNANGSVTIALYDGDTLLVSAVDDGSIGGAPIRAAGKVGLRGDNADLQVDNFTVSSLESPSAPPAPAGVSAIPGDGQATVRWDSAAGAVSYNLYRSRFPGVTKATGYKIENVTSPRLNTGFVNGTTYYMVVTAVNAAGESPVSAEVSALPRGVPPAAPLGVAALPGDGQVTARWDPVPGAVSYNLYRSRFPGVTPLNGYKIENAVSPRVNTGFINGISYYMVVTAVNAAGEGPASSEVCAVPAPTAAPPAAARSAVRPGDAGPRAFPNPWRAGQNGGLPITFDGLEAGAEVRIFTIEGRPVAALEAADARATWDVSEQGGGPAGSGLYVYRLSDGRHGVLAVVR